VRPSSMESSPCNPFSPGPLHNPFSPGPLQAFEHLSEEAGSKQSIYGEPLLDGAHMATVVLSLCTFLGQSFALESEASLALVPLAPRHRGFAQPCWGPRGRGH
jgi:hypothetical protein